MIVLYGLVPDDTSHVVTSKRHKTDEKKYFAVHVYPSIFGLFSKKPTKPSPP